MANKYNNAKIYRIVSNVTGENYYGSTTEPTLARRLAKHRSGYRQYLAGNYSYVTSFKILETEDYEIVLVENVNCNTKAELHQRERFYIENNECLNKQVPTRTHDEYLRTNQDKIKMYMRKYRADSLEKIKAQSKTYYENNKDKISATCKEYRENNKDKIKSRESNVKMCNCGVLYSHNHFPRHLKTKLHTDNLKRVEKRISCSDFEFLFYCDSKMLLPMTYPNYILI